jgi:hypothetical protein
MGAGGSHARSLQRFLRGIQMKNSFTKKNFCRLVILCVALFALAGLSTARSPTTSVNIMNNSSKEIRNVYLSHVDVDDWGTNQLENTTISPGQSFTITNFTCDGQQIKVIGEDQNGCFLSTVITCGNNATWTITNDTAADCGS